MKSMKFRIATLFSLALLAACGGEEAAAPVTTASETPATTPAETLAQTGDPIATAIETMTEPEYRRHRG